MKSGGLKHPKLDMLAGELGCCRAKAVGHLEYLWHFAGEYTPAGDIGKYSDEVIADRAEWHDNAERFIDALVVAGWLDRDEQHRLVIHDWAEHCPDTIHLRLARACQCFVTGIRPKMARLSRAERESIEERLRAKGACAQVSAPACAQGAHGMRTESALPYLTLPNQESAANRGGEPPADPLDSFPALQAAYPELQGMLRDSLRLVAPKAEVPAPSSTEDRKSREALAQLVRLDGHSEADIDGTLRWLFKSNDEAAIFWRQQVHSFAAIRRSKDGLSKFAKVHAARLKADGGGRGKGEAPLDPDLIAIFGEESDA